MKCERCDSTENTKKFTFFEKKTNEILCWECRKPIVYDRIAALQEDESDESNDKSELAGQVSLTDF